MGYHVDSAMLSPLWYHQTWLAMRNPGSTWVSIDGIIIKLNKDFQQAQFD